MLNAAYSTGPTPTADRLPAFFAEEPLLPHGEVFDVADTELDAIWEELQTVQPYESEFVIGAAYFVDGGRTLA
jgi:hypothetical protein